MKTLDWSSSDHLARKGDIIYRQKRFWHFVLSFDERKITEVSGLTLTVKPLSFRERLKRILKFEFLQWAPLLRKGAKMPKPTIMSVQSGSINNPECWENVPMKLKVESTPFVFKDCMMSFFTNEPTRK